MIATEIARVCHAANRALQEIQLEEHPTRIPVSPPWDETDEETQRSIVEGVQGILNGNTPEQSHESWWRFKVEHGWTLGPVKDLEKKEHPLLVPYTELPPSQQVKDHLFSAIIHALADA